MSKIPICYCTSSYYVPWLKRSIYDLIIRKNPDTELDIYILLNQAKPDPDFEKFNKLDKVHITIKKMDTSMEFPNHVPHPMPWLGKFRSLNMLIPELDIFKDFERILYLDLDMMARRDITPIYELDIKGAPLGMIKDWYYCRFVDPKSYLTATNTYQNGLIIMDLPKLREKHFTQQCKMATRSCGADITIINTVAHDYIHSISPIYQIPYWDIILGNMQMKDVKNWNVMYDTNFESMHDLIDQSYFFHWCGDKDYRYNIVPICKNIIDQAQKRLDKFLQTGVVQEWTDEDERIFVY